MTILRKDPLAGVTPSDGSIIRTDQHNQIVDELRGDATTGPLILAFLT